MKQACALVLAEFTEQCPRLQSEKLEFTGVSNNDVYNLLLHPLWMTNWLLPVSGTSGIRMVPGGVFVARHGQ